MYELSSYENNHLVLAQNKSIHVYIDFLQSMDSDLFETFKIEDTIKFANDIVNVYMSLLRADKLIDSGEYSVPLFNDILEESIYFYYRRLYDTTSDYYEDYSQNLFELEDNLYVSGAYHEFMDFVYTVLNINNLTFGYSDFDDKSIFHIIIINDAQIDIFGER